MKDLLGLLPFLLILACPLMMIFMMRGMHGGHGSRDDAQGERHAADHAGHDMSSCHGQQASAGERVEVHAAPSDPPPTEYDDLVLLVGRLQARVDELESREEPVRRSA